MIHLLKAEYLKLRTTQVWFWMLVAAAAVTGLIVTAQIASSGGSGSPNVITSDNVASVFTSSGTAYIVVFVLGVLGITTEFRYQTITPTVLATPSRWALVTAKMIFYALVGAVYALICTVVLTAIAVPWLNAKHISYSWGSDHVFAALVAVFISVTLFGLVGLGFGALVKNQMVAVSVGVIFLIVLNRLLLLIPGVRVIYPYTPDGALTGLLTVTGAREIGSVTLLSQPVSAIILLMWAIVPAIIGAAITMNRDIT